MRRWGVLILISVSVFVAPIVAAAPAHADCALWMFGRCIGTSPPPTSAPTPPTTQPPAPPAPAPPPPPAPAPSIDPNAAASQFFDLTNGERAAAGAPALEWRGDVAGLAVAHSVEMAQAGSIWHGSFVSQANLKAFNANLIGENVGMGGDVPSIHVAFMNSEHHRDNILNPGFNQVGIGVIVSGDTVYVTEDFLHSKSAGTARPAPVAHPAVRHSSAPRPPAPKVAAAPPKHAVAAAAPVSAPGPATAAPSPVAAPIGVVNAVPLDPAAAAATAVPAGMLSDVLDGGTAIWVAMFGALLVVGALGGHVSLRRRRSA